jgi:hypothetical protein
VKAIRSTSILRCGAPLLSQASVCTKPRRAHCAPGLTANYTWCGETRLSATDRRLQTLCVLNSRSLPAQIMVSRRACWRQSACWRSDDQALVHSVGRCGRTPAVSAADTLARRTVWDHFVTALWMVRRYLVRLSTGRNAGRYSPRFFSAHVLMCSHGCAWVKSNTRNHEWELTKKPSLLVLTHSPRSVALYNADSEAKF